MNNHKVFKPTLLASAVAIAFSITPNTVRAAGNPVVGPTFTVPLSNGTAPLSVARADSGVFILGWRGDSTSAASTTSVQTFNNDGTPLSAEIRLVSDLFVSNGSVSKIAVAADLDGDFVASWISSNPNKIYAQRFSQAGDAQGKQVTVAAAPQTLDLDWQNDTFIRWLP